MYDARFRTDQTGTGSLSTIYYKSESNMRMVALFRRYHGTGGSWNGLIQLGPGGIAKVNESPRATLNREIPEELPQLDVFICNGKITIHGFDDDGIMGIPYFVTADHIRPKFNVHMFLVEIPEEAAILLSNHIPKNISELAAKITILFLDSGFMGPIWTTELVSSIINLLTAMPLASQELSFPLFMPEDLVRTMIQYSPHSFMPHYSVSCPHGTNYDVLMRAAP